MIDNINVRDFLDDCERNGCVTHGEPFDIKYFEDKLILLFGSNFPIMRYKF